MIDHSRIIQEYLPKDLPILPVAGAASILALSLYWAFKPTKAALPPGPPPLPLVGNVHQLPTKEDYVTFTNWAKQYGEIVHVSVFGRPVIILNSFTAINALLEKKSNIYSHRPVLHMSTDLVGWGKTLALTSPDNERFKKYRKAFHSTLNGRVVKDYQVYQYKAVHQYLEGLFDRPEDFRAHIRYKIARTVALVAYGYELRPPSPDPREVDPYLQLADVAADHFSKSTRPGAYLVDFLPILKYVPEWLPGAGFKREARIWRKDVYDLHQLPYDHVKSQLEDNKAVTTSFTTRMLEPENFRDLYPNAYSNGKVSEQEAKSFADDVLMWSAGAVYAAGADTTVAGLTTFILAMLLNPEVQTKAWEEISMVCGGEKGRLPMFEDRENLVYVECIVKEVLRWHPVSKTGVPHRLVQDDNYKGYRIPAGSTVVGNIWALGHDEEMYPEPYKFNPDRFLPRQDGSPNPVDPKTYAFGWGRRVCPGQALAEASLFLSVASTLATFKIEYAVDIKTGRIIVPEVRYAEGVISHPEEFQCRFVPRHGNVESLIRGAVSRDRQG